MKRFIVKNPFEDTLSGNVVGVGDVIEADEEREKLLREADVIGKEVVEPNENAGNGNEEKKADAKTEKQKAPKEEK
ncbi:hypothetical protein HGI30_15260 [Paenibacillus albicereus]|uniref:Uncharacterized protein n=1 Tax=Paenibacillus albicereus TaxID=2726185 RepID=A0A6H2GZC9_9BACL|nr:hypothetical protein [Paenibacillus albicereus]QJC52791.1 hypothetical protein HGI30_15260 [Paenibacillus albicereus]